MQPVVWRDEVWIVAGWHGPWPDGEKDLTHVLIYNPKEDTLRTGCAIPQQYGRGAAGVVAYKDKFFITNGAVNGATP